MATERDYSLALEKIAAIERSLGIPQPAMEPLPLEVHRELLMVLLANEAVIRIAEHCIRANQPLEPLFQVIMLEARKFRPDITPYQTINLTFDIAGEVQGDPGLASQGRKPIDRAER